jgi:hypothetical protein
MMSKKLQTRASAAQAAAILLAQASACLDLAAKSREFWVTASLIDLARELQNRANRDRRLICPFRPARIWNTGSSIVVGSNSSSV